MADPNPTPSPSVGRTSPSQAPAASRQAPSAGEFRRYRLARTVVVGSFLTIAALVFALLVIAAQNNQNATNIADKTFTTVLPVLAAWMGTVLAFYFSAQSQDRTSDSLDRMISQAAAAPTPGVAISEKMIPFVSIKELYDLSKRRPDQIKLSELQGKFDLNAVPPITRLIFHDNGVFRAVLHIGELNRVLTSGKTPDNTFDDLLKDPESLMRISKLVVFVSPSTTLAEAKTKLEAVAGAQDIIVTDTGDASGRILGWLSNTDLTKALTVNS